MTKTSTILWGVALSCVLTLQTKLWADSEAPVPTSTSGSFKQVYDLGGKLLVDETLDVTGRIKSYKDVIAATGTFTTLTATTGTIKSFMVVGTATNDNAPTGRSGEQIETVNSSLVNVPASTNYGDIVSVTLTPGDWDISFQTTYAIGTGVGVTQLFTGIGNVTGNDSTGLDESTTAGETGTAIPNATANETLSIGGIRKSLAVTTTFYLKSFVRYSSGNPKHVGRISARRLR